VARILTAVAPDTEERVRRILTGHELLFVRDLSAAKAALESDRVALIFVGARFDESRMFDLLDYIRRDVQHKKIPIVAGIIGATTMTRVRIIVDALLLPPNVVPDAAEKLSRQNPDDAP
jgi:PleD family two-component response regulator